MPLCYLEVSLAANPEIIEYGPILPRGLTVILPDDA
ncbi:tail protein X [Bartonella phoceensis]|nr:tail protein X [Bartonella phoceensis]